MFFDDYKVDFKEYFMAIKLKLYNSSLLHCLSSNPRYDTYICLLAGEILIHALKC